MKKPTLVLLSLMVFSFAPLTFASTSQKSFATPKAAADAFIQAASGYNVPALLEILGSDARELITSQDPTQDKSRALQFAEKAREKIELKTDPKVPNRATLVVGKEKWPFPIPLVKANAKWRFDPKAGHDEILRRRIGANELDAITVCRGYVEAQKDYASQIHDNSGPNQYAQRIISSPGKHDGLAWQNADGSWGGPVGHAVAQALEQGYSQKGGPYHGYYFKVLKGQGSSAPLGKFNYVIDGAMIGGFALLAWPAEYGVTGVKTFMVSHDGIVYQKDLGPNSTTLASAIERYDPNPTWKRTNDDWLVASTAH